MLSDSRAATTCHTEMGEFDGSDLRLLMTSNRDGAALYAAWETAYRHALRGRAMPESTAEIAWFVGYVEGRFNIAVPAYFAQRLSGFRFAAEGMLDDAFVYFDPSDKKLMVEPPSFARTAESAVLITSGFELRESNGKWHIVGGVFDIPLEGFNATSARIALGSESYNVSRVVVYEHGGGVIVALPGGLTQFPVLAFGENGSRKWSAIVRASDYDRQTVFSGWFPNMAEIVVRDNRVFVFCVIDSCFIEVLDEANGKCCFRFSVEDWNR